MTRDEFWRHVHAAAARSPESPEAGLRDELLDMPVNELAGFQEHFDRLFDDAYRWDLWGAAHLIEGGCSDDGFTDFRYGLIARGQATFERALKAPDTLVELDDTISNEAFGYVASALIEERTGKQYLERYAAGPSQPAGEFCDFDDAREMQSRYPLIWAKYGWS